MSIIIVSIVTCCFLVWFLSEAVKSRRKYQTTADYFLWGHANLSTGEFAGTFIATNVTFTSSFLAIAVTAYSLGTDVIWLIASFIVGLIIFAFCYEFTIGKWVSQGKYGSMHEFLESHYGSVARKIGAINTVFSFLGTIALEFLGIQIILESMGAQPWITVIIFLGIASLTIAYTGIGGFREVVLSDIRQAKITMVAISVLILSMLFTFYMYKETGRSFVEGIVVNNSFSRINWLFLFSSVVLFFPFQFCVMDMWQRCRATSIEPKRVVKASLLSIPFVTIPLVLSGAIGLYFRTIVKNGVVMVPQQDNLALFLGLNKVLEPVLTLSPLLHTLIIAIFSIGLIMAAISTADTLISSIIYTIMLDLWAEKRVGKPSSLVILTKPLKDVYGIVLGLSIITGVLGILLTMLRWSFYDLAMAIFGAQVGFAIPLALAFFLPDHAYRFKPVVPLALLIGLVTPPIMVLAGRLLGAKDLISGAPVIAFVLVFLVILVYCPFAIVSSKIKREAL